MNNSSIPAETNEKLTVIEPRDSMIVVRKPGKILEEAIKAAEALKRVIDSKPRKVILNGEVFLENEDWLTVARFYGVTSRVRSTKYVQYGDESTYLVRGFEAVAEAYLVEQDKVISTAESMCLSDEPNWMRKPLFQLRSMAQTRASSRVLRQVFGWVVVLAGYRPTPAEEIQDQDGARISKSVERCDDCGDDVPAAQAVAMRKLYKKPLCKVCEKSHIRAKEGQIMQPMQDPQFVQKSVEATRAKRAQPIVNHIDAELPDEIAGD